MTDIKSKREALEKLYRRPLPTAILINVFSSVLIGAFGATFFLRYLPIKEQIQIIESAPYKKIRINNDNKSNQTQHSSRNSFFVHRFSFVGAASAQTKQRSRKHFHQN